MLFDSNPIIYAARPEYEELRDLVVQEVPSVSVVSKVETLGYPELSEQENRFLEEFFEAAKVLPVSESVVTEATRLRQQRSMSLGDALIAGTALSHGVSLATHNTSDFEWIKTLEVTDPLAEKL